MFEDKVEDTPPSRDRRLFPRLNGGLPMRYQPSDANDAISYLAGADPDPEAWCTPDPYMNFSVEGLEFHSAAAVPETELLLIELRVGHNPQPWRCTAHIVRRGAGSDPDFPHTTAVRFDQIPPEATEALAEFTANLQAAFLGKD